MSAWTHSICEACWIDRNSTIDAEGHREVRRPVLARDAPIEICCFCGAPTIVGCYVRAQPMETCRHRDEDEANP